MAEPDNNPTAIVLLDDTYERHPAGGWALRRKHAADYPVTFDTTNDTAHSWRVLALALDEIERLRGALGDASERQRKLVNKQRHLRGKLKHERAERQRLQMLPSISQAHAHTSVPSTTCDVTECEVDAVTCIVGEAGDFWLCADHAMPSAPSTDTEAQP